MEVLVARTLIHPSNLDASLAFYRDRLGLAVAREFGEGEQRGIVFHTGGGLLEVVGGSSRPRGERPRAEPAVGGSAVGGSASPTEAERRPVALWFQVRNLRTTVSALESRGVVIVRPARLEAWGLLEAWIADPDGLRIHLVEVPDTHPLRRDTRNIGPPGTAEQALAGPHPDAT